MKGFDLDDLQLDHDDVVWSTRFGAWPEMSVPHDVEVYVLRDLDALRRVMAGEQAVAWSICLDEPDDGNLRAVILLAAPVELSTLIHETVHVGLLWARDRVRRKQRAYGWLSTHPEGVPDLIGNLAALVWHALPAELRAVDRTESGLDGAEHSRKESPHAEDP